MLIATGDVLMADPDSVPAPAPVPIPVPVPAPAPAATPVADPAAYVDLADRYHSLAARLEDIELGVDRQLYDHVQWIQQVVQNPLLQVQELWETVHQLMMRLSDLEDYLGVQGGTQAIVLCDSHSA